MTYRILTTIGGAPIGGAEAFFVTLTLALQRAGHVVHSALRPSPIREADLAAAGIPYDRAPFGGQFEFWTSLKLAAVAYKFQPNVVLSFAARANWHMPWGNYTRIGRLGGYYRMKYFKHCDYLVCNAPDLVRHVVEGGWPRERVELISNFPIVMEGEAFDRSAFDTPKGVPLAVSLGRLHRFKAHDTLIRAMALLSDLYLWIAGEGEERANLEALTRELGVAERVKFIGWHTNRASLFKGADICIFPSRREPLGNVVLEAWHYGVPLVTTASIGPKWLTRHGEDAIVTPIDDVAALADGVRTVLASKTLARRLVENGRKRVAAEFSESAIIAHYNAFFDRVDRKAWR